MTHDRQPQSMRLAVMFMEARDPVGSSALRRCGTGATRRCGGDEPGHYRHWEINCNNEDHIDTNDKGR